MNWINKGAPVKAVRLIQPHYRYDPRNKTDKNKGPTDSVNNKLRMFGDAVLFL